MSALMNDTIAWHARTVGDIGVSLPGSTGVFRRFGLDFSCGGDQSLADAAARHDADLAALEAALSALDTGEGSALPHHEAHRAELPELVRLARKVESMHAAHPEIPRGLADLLGRMHAELDAHMQKEEQILFPLIRQGHPMVLHPIRQMRHEHDEQAANLQLLRSITNGFIAPADACHSWQALYVGTAKLVGDLMEHIHLENNALFRKYG
jgi:regulator of cell morphogenesis and NO signaling